MFTPFDTSALVSGPSKTLLYAHHGWGKTTQAKYYQQRYGRGLVISGESGLRSLMFQKLEYVPFSSWDGEHDNAKRVYSFRGLCRDMATPAFQSAGYQWLMIDSWTEVSERLMEELEPKYAAKKDGFALWNEYASLMLGAAKWVRDLPLHVLVTCLAKEEDDDNGGTDYWPSIKGKAVAKSLPGIFDNVFGGVRVTSGDRAAPKITRYVVTDEVRGWHGKARDERRRLLPVEKCDDITELLERIAMTDAAYEEYQRAMRAAKAAQAAPTNATTPAA